MDLVKLQIDGKNVEAPVGTTVLDAAQSIGIRIPALCYDPDLSSVGACRLCVVEIDGMRNLPTSCVTACTEGMVVRTGTPAVVEARRTILELLIANHPLDCMTCERSGECLLQQYCYEYGVTADPFHGDRHKYEIDDSNPFYLRDMNKCITCGRCIRACEEIVGRSVLDFSYRGFNTKVGPFMDTPIRESDCVYCGSCLAVCPTGALTERDMVGKGRRWEVAKVRTTCPYCGTGCNFDLNVKDGKVIGVTSTDGDVNGRFLCVKGRFGYQFIHSGERLKTPLIKRNGEFKEATWAAALELIGRKFMEIKDEHGPDAFGVLSSARCTNEESYLLNRFARAAIGTNNIDHCARLCHASTVAGLATVLGSGAMTNSIGEIADADLILCIGTNTVEAHPVIGYRINQALRKGAQLVVIDPRETDLAKWAHEHLQLKSGTDIALINGLLNVIIGESLWNKEFVANRTEGFDEMRALVSKYTPEYAEGITGIPAEKIRAIARAYAKADKATILYTMGITQHTVGTHNVFSVANLALICGQIGRPSTGVNPLRGQNNVQGACDMGALPNVLTAYQSVTDPAARDKFGQAWNCTVGDRPGLTISEMMNAAAQGSLKAMYIMGENPLLSDPDANHVAEALKNLDILVVQDIFLTETAQLADVVLPAASFAEKEGTFTSTERNVQLIRKAVEPPGQALPDWEIICSVATAIGYPMSYGSASAVFDEMAAVTPSYAGISHARIEKKGLRWPCPSPEHPGTPILHTEKFTRGLGRFSAVEHIDPDELPDAEYPLLLDTGRRLYHYHTGTMSRKGMINEFMPADYLEVNCADAEHLGISDGERVRVRSRRGTIEIAVRVGEVVPPGVVFTSFHFTESPVNRLTNPKFDPIAKIPELKICAVKVEKIA